MTQPPLHPHPNLTRTNRSSILRFPPLQPAPWLHAAPQSALSSPAVQQAGGQAGRQQKAVPCSTLDPVHRAGSFVEGGRRRRANPKWQADTHDVRPLLSSPPLSRAPAQQGALAAPRRSTRGAAHDALKAIAAEAAQHGSLPSRLTPELWAPGALTCSPPAALSSCPTPSAALHTSPPALELLAAQREPDVQATAARRCSWPSQAKQEQSVLQKAEKATREA